MATTEHITPAGSNLLQIMADHQGISRHILHETMQNHFQSHFPSLPSSDWLQYTGFYCFGANTETKPQEHNKDVVDWITKWMLLLTGTRLSLKDASGLVDALFVPRFSFLRGPTEKYQIVFNPVGTVYTQHNSPSLPPNSGDNSQYPTVPCRESKFDGSNYQPFELVRRGGGIPAHAILLESGKYSCSICNVVHGRKDSLVRHLAIHIKGEFQCPLFRKSCENSCRGPWYYRWDRMKAHLLRFHKGVDGSHPLYSMCKANLA